MSLILEVIVNMLGLLAVYLSCRAFYELTQKFEENILQNLWKKLGIEMFVTSVIIYAIDLFTKCGGFQKIAAQSPIFLILPTLFVSVVSVYAFMLSIKEFCYIYKTAKAVKRKEMGPLC